MGIYECRKCTRMFDSRTKVLRHEATVCKKTILPTAGGPVTQPSGHGANTPRQFVFRARASLADEFTSLPEGFDRDTADQVQSIVAQASTLLAVFDTETFALHSKKNVTTDMKAACADEMSSTEPWASRTQYLFKKQSLCAFSVSDGVLEGLTPEEHDQFYAEFEEGLQHSTVDPTSHRRTLVRYTSLKYGAGAQ